MADTSHVLERRVWISCNTHTKPDMRSKEFPLALQFRKKIVVRSLREYQTSTLNLLALCSIQQGLSLTFLAQFSLPISK